VKLRKHSSLKALITAAAAGLLFVLFALVRADPRIEAESGAAEPPPVDYDRFFSSGRERAPAPPQATPAERTHTRTRAS
jgi:hypothetical protein